MKPKYECRHKWKPYGRDQVQCVKCKSIQLVFSIQVESVQKQKKTLQPNKIIPMLHQ